MSFLSLVWSAPAASSTAFQTERSTDTTDSTVGDPFTDGDRRRVAFLLAKRRFLGTLEIGVAAQLQLAYGYGMPHARESGMPLTFGKKIRQLRKEKGLGQRAVAA